MSSVFFCDHADRDDDRFCHVGRNDHCGLYYLAWSPDGRRRMRSRLGQMQTKCTVSISSFYPSMEIDDSIVQGSYQSKFIFKH